MAKIHFYRLFHTIITKSYFRIIGHILFWAITAIFLLVLFKWNNQDVQVTKILTSILIPISAGVVYFFNYFLIPRYLLTKKYFRFFYLSFFTLLTSLWLSFITVILVLIFTLSKDPRILNPAYIHPELQIVVMYFIIFLAISIKQVKRAFIVQQEKNEINKIKLNAEIKLKEAELKLLKAQIQPHFLFNTLNNLYGLTLEKSDDAPDLVLQLSEILDYVLYRCNEKQVSLSDEINILNNYIGIEKLRSTERLELELNFQGKVDDVKIAPLLFIPFVENAFKHGVSNNPGKSKINIDLRLDGSELFFSICNSKNNQTNQNKISSGIGLKNVQKRLDLLYKDKHKLNIQDQSNEYCVNLTLDISN